ncbi:MAG: DNA cytosine methyltransferase [Pseudomonadota bacterium]
MSSDITAIDLFCGVGGLTRGLIDSGINVEAGIEIDQDCRFAYEANNNSHFIERDVAAVKAAEIQELFGDSPVTVLAGCAPCQPFSTFTQGRGRRGPRSNWTLLDQFGRLVEETTPDIVAMENVPSLQKHLVFRRFLDCLSDNGYRASVSVAACTDYGVPQLRRRLIVLASRMGPIELSARKTRKAKTVRDAIGGLPELEAGEQSQSDFIHKAAGLTKRNLQRIRASKPGGTWRDWNKNLRSSCHNKESGNSYVGVYGRMEWDSPAPTITTQFYNYGSGRFGHPDQDRAISLREGAVLQSFPKSYVFSDSSEVSLTKTSRLIGNAVPVKLGSAVGRSIKQHVSNI